MSGSPGNFTQEDLSREVPVLIVFFNRGMLAICAYMFSKVYALIYGEFGALEFPRGLTSFIIAASCYTLLNAIIIGQLAIQMKVSFITIWRGILFGCFQICLPYFH